MVPPLHLNLGTVPKLRFSIPCLLRTWCPTPSQRGSDNCHDLVF
ncbi:hypothetical protein COLSTE_02019 [Collinsella stercoris DSM 13279]|uniref:Uncharacterized protein n=1 Tax=Collinsella stercoris DSM 13279 TaxID=445975 RepID=B6GD40_9ACTN|nr:hypothetical protein COLSTE_02019 [Collinsella stercoris DSM 13279]